LRGGEVELGDAAPGRPAGAETPLDHVGEVARRPGVVGAGDGCVRAEPVLDEGLAAEIGTTLDRTHQLDAGRPRAGGGTLADGELGPLLGDVRIGGGEESGDVAPDRGAPLA